MAEYVVDSKHFPRTVVPFRGLNYERIFGSINWSERSKEQTPTEYALFDTRNNKHLSVKELSQTEQQIAKLRRLYELRDDAAIEAFLEEHPSLIQVLFKAYDTIRGYFGLKSRMALKISSDPEARGDDQLFVLIQTGLRPKAARTLLSALSQEWWHDIYPSTGGDMTISLEYLK